MFTVDERNELIQLFPKIVLSYGNNLIGSGSGSGNGCEKIKEDEVFVAVPEGKKYFAWFLHYRKQHMCVLIDMLPNNKFGKMFVVKTLFTRQLAAEGSIFYGTLFKNNNTQFTKKLIRN